MAAPTLPTLLPLAFDSETGTFWTTTTVGNIDNGVATPSGTFIVAGANSGSSAFYTIQNIPADFVDGGMLTLNYNIRYKIENLADDIETLFVRVWNAAKDTAYTNEETVVTTTSNISITNKGSTGMTLTAAGLAASKTEWEAALIEIRTDHVVLHGADGSVWSIDEVELTGTYDVPPTVALNTPENAATGVSTTPDLLFTGTDINSDEIEYNVQISPITFANNPKTIEEGIGDGGDGNDNASWSVCH